MWFTKLIRLVRYRFFVFAGLLPYLLGQVVAFGERGPFNASRFWWGLGGILLILVAVELFNEYFDAKEGGDRIFSPQPITVPKSFFALGTLAVAGAFVVAVYLTSKAGWPVLAFSFLGFLGAYFYVGPPVRWAYRGMGELVIALSYGPLMILGSYFIQTETVALTPFLVSLVCGLSMFCLAIVNEIPDYYQDKLVGKLNLVVRLGKPKAILLLELSLGGLFVLLILAAVLRVVPLLAMAVLPTVPWIYKSVRRIEKNYDNPKAFLFAVNTVVISHLILVASLGVGFLKGWTR
jgi:1,4-dihydroxy-2-naphthoate octaprenyltransferase